MGMVSFHVCFMGSLLVNCKEGEYKFAKFILVCSMLNVWLLERDFYLACFRALLDLAQKCCCLRK